MPPTDTQLWLVIVAVGRYADPSLPPLPGVIQDANRLADVLRDRGAALAGAVPLFNARATRDRILDSLRAVAGQALQSHQVVFWFGGHGCERPGGDAPLPDGMTRYLLPHDATPETAETTGISMKQLADALAALWAGEVVVILDCCHGGGLAAAFASQLGDLLQQHKSRYVLAAARPVQEALETDAGSPLTQSFCDALEGQISVTGWVTATLAGHHAQECVRAAARHYHHRQQAVAFEIGSPIRLARPRSPGGGSVKVWQLRVCYPLQPARQFEGRQTLRRELVEWVRSGSASPRVVALVAMGGTGKTALAERVLADLGDHSQAGLFVWSLYENPRADDFFRAACDYFTGETPTSAGGLVHRLQAALAGDAPHLLVLDGLERVQSDGTAGPLCGELEDPELRGLLRWLAAGHGTRTRALVTSRFPLADLGDWKDGRYREQRLDDLEPRAAWEVLRHWGVKGDDATLDGLAAPLHYHALSVAVLGSYLGQLWGGDPGKAPTFDRAEEAATDPKAARLGRVLEQYAAKLADAERDLLARLSAFVRGVTLESLGYLVEAGGAVAGALDRFSAARLRRSLERLRDLGLVFAYDTPAGPAFSAHPVIRDYFRHLLSAAKPEQVHEAVRSRLLLRLEGKPRPAPHLTTPAELDLYEDLIEHTRLAGRWEDAFEIYRIRLGGCAHLGSVLGDFARGFRVVSALLQTEGRLPGTVPASWRGHLLNDLGVFAVQLGDLAAAQRAVGESAELARREPGTASLPAVLYNLAGIRLRLGKLPAAEQAAAEAVAEAEKSGHPRERKFAHACLAAVQFRMGKVEEARRQFALATDLEPEGLLYSQLGLYEAEAKLAAGDRAAARSQTLANRAIAARQNWVDDVSACDALLGLLELPHDLAAARSRVAAARGDGVRSRSVDLRLVCRRLEAEIARLSRDLALARAECAEGLLLADKCGFGLHAIELRLTLARACADDGDGAAALRWAREALALADHEECRDAWGEADALHLCGLAHAQLGDVVTARDHLAASAAKRRVLGHPGPPEIVADLN